MPQRKANAKAKAAAKQAPKSKGNGKQDNTQNKNNNEGNTKQKGNGKGNQQAPVEAKTQWLSGTVKEYSVAEGKGLVEGPDSVLYFLPYKCLNDGKVNAGAQVTFTVLEKGQKNRKTKAIGEMKMSNGAAFEKLTEEDWNSVKDNRKEQRASRRASQKEAKAQAKKAEAQANKAEQAAVEGKKFFVPKDEVDAVKKAQQARKQKLVMESQGLGANMRQGNKAGAGRGSVEWNMDWNSDWNKQVFLEL